MNHTIRLTTPTQSRPRLQPWRLPKTAPGWYASPADLATLAERFAPISLKQMNAVALLNRTDTKFVLTSAQLLDALAALQPHYQILAVHGRRLNHYRTLYFDTPDFALYHMHVNGRANRYKVRSREYTDSRLSFLEVKHKTSKGRTLKERIPTYQPLAWMTCEAENWLQDVFPYDSRALEPKLWNTFTRLTLVSHQHCERVTLDVDLTFYAAGQVWQPGNIVIAELKREAAHRVSLFLAQMRAQKIHPRGFSKYCTGVSMLYDQVKKNALKPRLLWIEKMNRGATCHE